MMSSMLGQDSLSVTRDRLSVVSPDDFWEGHLTPYSERGEVVEERYAGVRATLLVDEARDYFRFDASPSPSDLDHYYNHIYNESRRSTWYNLPQQYLPSRWETLVRRVDEIKSAMAGASRSLKIHDVGCAHGGLVDSLRRRGYEATGTDLCREAIEAGRSERDNRWIYAETAQTHLTVAGLQDVLVLNHMLEHAVDPLEFLREVAGHLAPGGHVVIRCPNSRYLLSTETSIKASWYGFPKHLHYFGPRSLGRLVELAGFTDVEVRTTDTEMGEPKELQQLMLIASRYPDLPSEAPLLVKELTRRLQGKEVEVVARRRS